MRPITISAYQHCVREAHSKRGQTFATAKPEAQCQGSSTFPWFSVDGNGGFWDKDRRGFGFLAGRGLRVQLQRWRAQQDTGMLPAL